MGEVADRFPEPTVSSGFYAAYLAYASIAQAKHLHSTSKLPQNSLKSETLIERRRIALMNPGLRSRCMYTHLSNTVALALHELVMFEPPLQRYTTESGTRLVQEYLTGPVEDSGLELAKRLGNLSSRSVPNPFSEIEFVRSMQVQAADTSFVRPRSV